MLFVQGLTPFRQASGVCAIRRTDQLRERLQEALNPDDDRTDPETCEGFGQLDTRPHRVIAGASGNPSLQVAIDTLQVMQLEIVTLITWYAGIVQAVRGDHRAIVDAIATQDTQTASPHMVEQIAYTSQVVEATFLTSPQAPRPERRETRKKDA